ncbi:MAG: hypothetical protein ACPG19_07705 [Saprospiraceae bacterium]
MNIKSIFTIKNLGIILIIIGISCFFTAFSEMNSASMTVGLSKGGEIHQEFIPVSINAGLVALASSIIIFSGVQLINGAKKKD